MTKPYRNPMHGMARRRHTSSRHYQRRRSSNSGCGVYLLMLVVEALMFARLWRRR